MRIQVKDFMSSPVVTAVGGKRVQEIRTLMKRKGIHAIPIIEYAKQLPDVKVTIRGIVTSSDLNDDVDANTRVEELMTSNVHIVHQNSSAQAAAKMMLKHQVHHIVVMDEGKITGMISSLDFVKLVAMDATD
jgi:CBS domain-containing protein